MKDHAQSPYTITTKPIRKSLLVALGFLPCLVWGCITLGSIALRNHISWACYLSGYQVYRVMYLLRSLVFLPILMAFYKQSLPNFTTSCQKLYVQCSLLAMVCLVGGFFVEMKFWNYMLDGCLVSPLLEEIIARFMLYEARNSGFKTYLVVAILSSFSFGIMHFFYEPTALLDKTAILPKLNGHFVFGLILCGIFWFLPNLRLLILLHSLSNLWSILARASELGV